MDSEQFLNMWNTKNIYCLCDKTHCIRLSNSKHTWSIIFYTAGSELTCIVLIWNVASQRASVLMPRFIRVSWLCRWPRAHRGSTSRFGVIQQKSAKHDVLLERALEMGFCTTFDQLSTLENKSWALMQIKMNLYSFVWITCSDLIIIRQ